MRRDQPHPIRPGAISLGTWVLEMPQYPDYSLSAGLQMAYFSMGVWWQGPCPSIDSDVADLTASCMQCNQIQQRIHSPSSSLGNVLSCPARIPAVAPQKEQTIMPTMAQYNAIVSCVGLVLDRGFLMITCHEMSPSDSDHIWVRRIHVSVASQTTHTDSIYHHSDWLAGANQGIRQPREE